MLKKPKKATGDWNTLAEKLVLLSEDHGMKIYGKPKQKPEDKSTIMILPGFNDDTVSEIKRLGLI